MVEGGLDVNLIACAEKPSDVDQIYGVFPRADADVRNSSGFSIRFLEHHCDNLGGCASRCGHPPPPRGAEHVFRRSIIFVTFPQVECVHSLATIAHRIRRPMWYLTCHAYCIKRFKKFNHTLCE